MKLLINSNFDLILKVNFFIMIKKRVKIFSDSSNNEEKQSNNNNSDCISGQDDIRNTRAYSISPFRPKKMFVMDCKEEEKLSEHSKEENDEEKHLIRITTKA